MKVTDAVTIGPVQVIPAGFTGFFQIKQTGQSPGMFTEFIQPSVDLRDWYLNSRTVTELNLLGAAPVTGFLVTGNTQARFYSPTVTVPQNQIWYVWDYTCIATKGATTDVISFAPLLNPNSGGSIQILAPMLIDVPTARVDSPAVRNQAPFWANPGDTLGVWIEDILASTNITVQGRLRVTVLPT